MTDLTILKMAKELQIS